MKPDEPLRPPSAFDVQRARLAAIPLFEGLSDEALQLVSRLTKDDVFDDGAFVVSAETHDVRLVMVIEGSLSIDDSEASGARASIVATGGVVGIHDILMGERRQWSARAHGRTRVLSLAKDAFDDLLFLHKDLAYEVLWNAVRWMATHGRGVGRDDKGSLRPMAYQSTHQVRA